MTAGSVEPLAKLYEQWGERVHFVDVLIRQAHPGPSVRPYRDFAQKQRDARTYQMEVPYSVLIDDLAGTTHQVYGGLADPTYLIDADGRVAFYNMWTHAPTLHTMLKKLFQQGGRGVIESGYDRTPHILASLTDGWKGLRRGLPQSFIELELASPGVASGTWVGYQMRSVLAPLTLRAKPLPIAVKVGLAVGVGALFALCLKRLARS